MKNRSLDQIFRDWIKNMPTDVGLYRIMSILSALAFILSRPMFPAESIDPMAVRFALSGAMLAFFAATIVLPFVRRKVTLFAHALIYVVCIWAAWLAYTNNFITPYIFNFFVVLPFSALNFKRLTAWLPFCFVVLATFCFACIVIDPFLWKYSVLVVLNLLISALMVGFRSYIQTELSQQDELLNSVFASSANAIFLLDAKSLEVSSSNKPAKRIFKADNPEKVQRLHHQIQQFIGKELAKSTWEEKQVVTMADLDGKMRWLEAEITKLKGKQSRGVLLTLSDITEKVGIEKRLKLSDEILQKVDHLVIVCDANADVVYITPSIEQMLGYKPDEILGQGWWEIKRKYGLDPAEDIAYIKEIGQGNALPSMETYENQVFDAKGNAQWMIWQDSLTETGFVMGVGMLNTQSRKDALIRSVVFKIAEASSKVKRPGEFYAYIHREIRRIIDTPNFYVAVYNAEFDEVEFPYYTDAEDPDYMVRASRKRKAGKGLTEYCIRKREPVLLSKEDIEALNELGHINVRGQAIPEVWLGVPMIDDEKVVGIMTIQNYQNSNAYSTDDLSLVNFVASQVAQFVAKLQADEALRASEERFRSIYNQAAVGIAQLAPDGTFIQVNQKMVDIFGYPNQDLKSMSPRDFTHPEDKQIGMRELSMVLEGELESYSKEKRYIHRDGHTVHALVNVSAYRENGVPIFIISIYEDITQKRKTEEENELLLQLSTRLSQAKSIEDIFLIASNKLSRLQSIALCDAAWKDSAGNEHHLQQHIAPDKSLEGLGELKVSRLDDYQELDASIKLIWLDIEDPRLSAEKAAGIRSAAMIPVRQDGKIMGMLVVMSKENNLDRQQLGRVAAAVNAQLETILAQKLADEARIESENRYRAITQAAFDGIAIYQDGKFGEANQAFADIFGYETDEILSLQPEDLECEQSKGKLVEALEQGAKLEFVGKTKLGERIFVEVIGRADRWHGLPAKIVAIRDITSQKQAEEAQATAKIDGRFRAYVQNSSELIFILDAEGKIQYCGPSTKRILNLEPDQLIGTSQTEMLLAEDRASFELAFADVKQAPLSTAQLQLRIEVPGEGQHYLQASMTNLLEDASVKGVLLSAGDITGIIAAQRSMKESEERFRALVEHATEAIFVIDFDTNRLTEVNKNAETLFGYDRDTLMQMNPSLLNSQYQDDGMDSSTIQSSFFRRALNGEQVVFEWRFLRSDETEVPCEVRLVKFPSAKQRLVRGSVTDITERKRAELKMQRAKEMLRHQNEALIELAASHELNSGDLDLAFEAITESIAQLMQLSQASIWMFDAAGNQMQCRKRFETLTRDHTEGESFDMAAYPAYFQTLAQERVIAVWNTEESDKVAELQEDYLLPQDIKSTIHAPFRHLGRIAGVIWADQRQQCRYWEPEELNFVASVADMVSFALQSWEKKRAELELANTFGKMRAVFDSTKDGIVLVDPDGRLLDYNEEYQKLSKIPQAELDKGGVNAGFEYLLDNIKDPDDFMEAVERMQLNPDKGDRHIYQTKDGLVIEIYARKMVVNGQLLGRLWFLHDLTDLKRIETALLENEIRYRSIFSQANDAIMLLQNGAFVECNDKAEIMFGRPVSSIIGSNPSQLSPEFQPDGRRSEDAVKSQVQAVLEGKPQHFYWQHLKGDGNTFEAEVSLNPIQIGDQIFVQALVRDITERLQTENALRASERKNKALLDGIPDLILRLKTDGEILDLKRSDKQELFRGNAEVVGENVQTFLPQLMAEALLEAAQTVANKGESLQFETELPTGEGTQDFETRLVKSGPDEVLAIVRDVTTRKRTEKELIKRNFELDSFVYRASHDLKAPLNSLMGIIGLLEAESEEPTVLSYLKMMNKSVVKLDTFIRDLADFSRNARTELEHSEINWKHLVDETLENLQFADNSDRIAKNIKIEQEGKFYSDNIRLGIVFNNLISNAIKYQNLERPDAIVDVIIVSREDYATIVIADNGIGIAKEHQNKVYNLFFRASIQSYGSGMGMYIVKNAIERLKGEINMTSEEGQGTTFNITLPNLGKD